MAERNLYTDEMEKIKAPQSAVDRAVKAALEAEKNKGENKMVKTKSNIIKLVSAVAACAVVTGGITTAAILTQNRTNHSVTGANSFTLSVNAAEINKSAVEIGDISIDDIASGVTYVDPNYDPDDPNTSDIEFNDEQMRNQRISSVTYSPEIELLLSCTGNNIKTVTYSLKGGAFLLNNIAPENEGTVKGDDYMVYNRYADITSRMIGKTYEELVNTDPNSIEATAFAGREPNYVYSQFTVNKDEQAKLGSYFEDEIYGNIAPAVIISEGAYSWDPDLSGASKELIDYILSHNYGELLDLENAGKDTEQGQLKKAFLEEMINALSMDVKVVYEDNETASYTIQFLPNELLDGGFKMSVKARLVNINDADNSNTDNASAADRISINVNGTELNDNNEAVLTQIDLTSLKSLGMESLCATKTAEDTYLVALWPDMELPISLRGEDIKSVTYKVSGGAISALDSSKFIAEGTKEIMSKKEFFDIKYRYPDIYYDNDTEPDDSDPLYSEVTLSYNDQLNGTGLIIYPYSSYDERYSSDEKVKAAQAKINEFENFNQFLSMLEGELYREELNTVLDAMINGISIEMTIHFYDGTDMTRTVKLIPGELTLGGNEDTSKHVTKSIKAKIA